MEISENNTLNAKRTYSKVGFALFIIGLVSEVVGIIIVLLSRYVFKIQENVLQSGIYSIVLSLISIYLIAYPIGFIMLNNLPSFECQKKKMHLEQFLRYTIMCFSIMYFGNIIGTILSLLLSSGNAVNPLIIFQDTGLLVNFILAVCIAPVVEELIFRKQIIDHTKRFGEKSAIFFSALAFGLFHMNLFQFFYAFGIGLLFGYIYTRTSDIKYTIFMHMIVNFFGGIVAPFIVSHIDLDSIAAGNIYSYSDTGLAGFSIWLIILFLYTFAVLFFSIIGLVFLIDEKKKFVFETQPNEEGIKNAFITKYLNVGVILFVILCIGFIIYSLLV